MKNRCSFYLAINEDGDFEVATEADDAATLLADNVGGTQRRVVQIVALVTAPAESVAEVTVPDDAGRTETVEAAAE